jgi:hypothetical protein
MKKKQGKSGQPVSVTIRQPNTSRIHSSDNRQQNFVVLVAVYSHTLQYFKNLKAEFGVKFDHITSVYRLLMFVLGLQGINIILFLKEEAYCGLLIE